MKIRDIRGTELNCIADERVREMEDGNATTLEEFQAELSQKKTEPPTEPKE